MHAHTCTREHTVYSPGSLLQITTSQRGPLREQMLVSGMIVGTWLGSAEYSRAKQALPTFQETPFVASEMQLNLAIRFFKKETLFLCSWQSLHVC